MHRFNPESPQAVSRRKVLASAGIAAGAITASLAAETTAAIQTSSSEPFGYCLNFSTIRGQGLGMIDKVEIAARAGYTAIEPWIREIDEYVQKGGSLVELGKRISDLGLSVESVIGFAEWIVDDDAQRAKGLEEAKRNMDLAVQIGGKRLAAPPSGATKQPDLNLYKAAERYRQLLELGDQMGVVPQVEVWGFSQALSRLSEAAFVAIESGHPKARILPDVYHLNKGGSSFASLHLLSGVGMHVFHMNDYPAMPPRATITDADRIYPGDGIAPLDGLFRDLRACGYRGVLSLELFNREYWGQDALVVARTGLEKTRAAVQRAFS
jgi:sugar phosphate isomerase/epimerase